MKKIIIIIIVLCGIAKAQSSYEVTPGSKGNVIVLSVVNESTNEGAGKVTVSLVKEAKDIVVNNCTIEIEELKAGEEKEVVFGFDVNRNPSKMKDTLGFAITVNGNEKYNKEIIINYSLPTEFRLEQNYPNPFNPETTIEFSLPKEGKYVIGVYNILGESVKEIAEREFEAGYHRVSFDGSRFSSGVYFYNLRGEGVNMVKKMMLVK